MAKAAEKNTRILIDDFGYEIKEIATYSRVITDANILGVEVGTTGFCGGDGGHGGRTYFQIKNLSGTAIHVCPFESGGFEVTLYGDSELRTIIKALKFITTILNKKADETKLNEELLEELLQEAT